MIKSLFDVKAIKAYLMRIGAEPRSLHSAVVKEQAGKYWKDIAVVTVSRAGEVKTPAIYAPTESEAAAILHEAQQAEWPELAKINSIRNAPEAFKDEKPENLFEFRDENNNSLFDAGDAIFILVGAVPIALGVLRSMRNRDGVPPV